MRTLWITLLFFFFVTSWPFNGYPLTDADIAHWASWAADIAQNGHFLSAKSDQTHGPILAWTAAPLLRLAPHSFYLLNFFNLTCGLLGIICIYFFAQTLWKNPKLSTLSIVMFATSMAPIYLSRTPMYDWPAAIFYFAFCALYYAYIQERKPLFWLLAMLAIGIASLSRFSISIGLAGIYLIALGWILKLDWKLILRDGLCMIISAFGLNSPWLYVQIHQYGPAFSDVFIHDNVGRFISDQTHDTFQADFYAFPIYALLGIFPYTFLALATLFQKGLWKRLKDPRMKLLIASFLPCLLVFSLSGHTKLARYIAYAFPGLIMVLSYQLFHYDFNSQDYRKRTNRFLLITAGLLGLGIGYLLTRFGHEAKSSLLFTGAVIAFLGSLLALMAWILRKPATFLNEPTRFLPYFWLIYGGFFSIIGYLSTRVDFLNSVRLTILQALG